jgi:hypothetical protein
MVSAAGAEIAPGRVSVFGALLSADRPLPGLPVASLSSGHLSPWTLTTRTASTPRELEPVSPIVGTLHYSNGVVVQLVAGADGEYALCVSDTGRFQFHTGDPTITHIAPLDVDRAAVALDMIGIVLPFAMHQQGAWCLHASAVATPEGVIAFVAERGTGKSTLAAACVQLGCELVADDVVVLRAAAGGVSVTPSGVPLRLLASAARSVGLDASDADAWGKVHMHGALASGVPPLRAVYVLQAMDAAAEVERAPRAGRAAALALLAHGKLTPLLGGVLAATALTRCATIATAVPVLDLAVPRDLEQLQRVAATVLSWHGGATPATAVSA